MTLEEINNLKAGRETDAIVGLALKLLHKYEPKAKDECAICGGIERHGNHAGYGPCFTTHMNDAMRIAEKIGRFSIYSPDAPIDGCSSHSKLYGCEMVLGNAHASSSITAEAETAPLAICKCALKTTL